MRILLVGLTLLRLTSERAQSSRTLYLGGYVLVCADFGEDLVEQHVIEVGALSIQLSRPLLSIPHVKHVRMTCTSETIRELTC